MNCCGRPNNRAAKEGNYYERFAYLSSHQKQVQAETVGTTCSTCDAITLSAPGSDNRCALCGNPKEQPKVEG